MVYFRYTFVNTLHKVIIGIAIIPDIKTKVIPVIIWETTAT
jgi:hypothetical protein